MNTMSNDYRMVTRYDDVIDIRDVIAEYEDTEDDRDNMRPEIVALLNELAGEGGDEQWRGDWYPVTLIRDTYFTEYAREFAYEIGAVSGSESWPANCIDWTRAARELQMDYTSVEFDGVTYWYC